MMRTYLACFLIFLGAIFTSNSAYCGHLPNRLNIELLPTTASATHQRGTGFAFALERINPETLGLISIFSELSFPIFQKGLSNHVDWNGGLTLMGPIRESIYIGGKVGACMNNPSNQVTFYAVAFRLLPNHPLEKHFMQWVTKEVDLGTYANKNMYAAIRLGFSIL